MVARMPRLESDPDWARAREEKRQLDQRLWRTTQFVTFCARLRMGKKEPVYYGQVVKPGEAERVLLRWQCAPNGYRVIHGDLHAETVTADRWARLEAMLAK
jgi:hypothetical protein